MDNQTYIEKSFDANAQLIRNYVTAGIVMTRIVDSSVIQAMGRTNDPDLPDNEAAYFEARGKNYSMIKIPVD